MYSQIIKFDYICDEYSHQNYIKAYFYIGKVNLRFESDYLFSKEKAEYRMSEEGITFSTQPKEKEYKILLNNIPQDDVNDFLFILDSVYGKEQISDDTFNWIMGDFNNIFEY